MSRPATTADFDAIAREYTANIVAAIEEDDDALSGATNTKRPNRAPSRAPVDLTIALQAVQSAIEGLREVKPGLLRHQLDAALMDPLAHLGHATRAIEQEMRRVKRGWK